jgi:hypothetical protein
MRHHICAAPVPSLLKRFPLRQAYGLHDTIGCLLDCVGGTLSFTKNGKPLGTAFQLPQVGRPDGV